MIGSIGPSQLREMSSAFCMVRSELSISSWFPLPPMMEESEATEELVEMKEGIYGEVK